MNASGAGCGPARRFRPVAGGALALLLLAAASCHYAGRVAPRVPLRAAPASDFAVDLEFAESLDRATAEDVSHYKVYPAGQTTAALQIYSATVIDMLYGRVVQLLLSDGPLADSASYQVEAIDVRSLDGRVIIEPAVDFHAGLRYHDQIRPILAEHCNACHGPDRRDGNYRTDSLAELRGGGTNSTPNLIAGNAGCLLIRKTKPQNSMFTLGRLTFLDAEILKSWVVGYRAAP